jgi:ABC-type uncharacterized transport system permease subunit
MIEGITILSQTEMTEPSVTAFVVTFLIFIVLSVTVTIATDEGLAGISVLLLGLLISGMVSNAWSEPNGKIEYKVLFDDSVSISQVLEKYEIVNQEGLIYTIIERENEND